MTTTHFDEEEEPSLKQKPDFYTKTGREDLHDLWFIEQFEQGTIEQTRGYTTNEFRGFFEQWMRYLIKTGCLDPHRPLPTQAELARLFHIHPDQVARVIRRLRKEHLLPFKPPRMNAGEPEWTPRDRNVLWWIAHQKAARYDQVRRLLARFSSGTPKDPKMLSMSRTKDVIDRWVAKGMAIYRPILHGEPNWIWLTRKGLRTFSEESYRPGDPAPGSVTHLFWINEVRLYLEDLNKSSRVSWTSERFIQHRLEQMKAKESKQAHIPDGRVRIYSGETLSQDFEIEVELSRKNDGYLQRLMRGGDEGFTDVCLRYYVGEGARSTVLKALEKLPGTRLYRPWVEVYELDTWELLGRAGQKKDEG